MKKKNYDKPYKDLRETVILSRVRQIMPTFLTSKNWQVRLKTIMITSYTLSFPSHHFRRPMGKKGRIQSYRPEMVVWMDGRGRRGRQQFLVYVLCRPRRMSSHRGVAPHQHRTRRPFVQCPMHALFYGLCVIVCACLCVLVGRRSLFR